MVLDGLAPRRIARAFDVSACGSLRTNRCALVRDAIREALFDFFSARLESGQVDTEDAPNFGCALCKANGLGTRLTARSGT